MIRFNLVGLILFSLALIAGGAVTSGLLVVHARNQANAGSILSATTPALAKSAAFTVTPPWGPLVTRDIELERPEEYLAGEIKTNAPAWTFESQSADQVRRLLLECGLRAQQADHALSSTLAVSTPTNLVVYPDQQLLLDLTPETRAKLYQKLGQWPANHYMEYPFCFQRLNMQEWLQDSGVAPATIAQLKALLYPRAGGQCFSDVEYLMRSLATDQERLTLLKALSRQRALLVRLQIGPDTDIDKILGYWDRGIQVKDARPLLDSLKRLEGGGTMSLLYLLPRFARERLYTFPLPPKPNDPPIDCHWTTMNFFNEIPDNHFTDPAYTVQFLNSHFYRVAKPNAYGDLVFILNAAGNAIHSAVFLADDIVFTKNGNNYAQPWTLMRLPDLLKEYASAGQPQVAVYRNKSW